MLKPEERIGVITKIFFTFTPIIDKPILKTHTMAKGKDTQKAVKKEPLKTAKEKKAEKRDKKSTPKRD